VCSCIQQYAFVNFLWDRRFRSIPSAIIDLLTNKTFGARPVNEKTKIHLPVIKNLHTARRYVDRLYDQPITIEEMSAQAALSPFHFIRQFRRVFRQTPHQYIMRLRIDKAKYLLRSTDLPITEICAMVGFESLGSFSSLFSKQAGLSPSTYRIAARPNPALPTRHAIIPLCAYMLHNLPDDTDEGHQLIDAKESNFQEA
jgi:AraC-like DNA-binding protein